MKGKVRMNRMKKERKKKKRERERDDIRLFVIFGRFLNRRRRR